jgi:putative ABC transport system substrate-binding protein
VTRVVVVCDPAITSGSGYGALSSPCRRPLGLELRPVDVRDAGEIERALAAFARTKNGGLIATGSAATIVHRDRIISLAARHQLPAVYYDRYFAAGQ